MLRLLLKEITDKFVRKNFDHLQKEFATNPFLASHMRLFAYEFTQAATNQKIPHGLKFVPTDVIQTRLTGAGTVTWNYELFDNENLDVTVTGACKVRALIGGAGE